ncbi:MAG: peptide-methionine (S)-S-oxide reductase MsrA [Pseudazoarcus pumilus]|nr:peptide-methionine (S)-S-oxide reductase MsrA [Pseudazoarcus pumilus]
MSDSTTDKQVETAVFGGGCFWCTEAVFDDVEGVHKVEPGYCGGEVDHPTYKQICGGDTGHAEVVRISFDPEQVSYRDLLEIFFATHDPTTLNRQGNDIGTQYRSAIFPTSEEQLHEAAAMMADLEGEFAAPIVTSIEMPAPFWPAEDYHFDFFANHPEQPYCQAIVAPKLAKFRAKFASRRKKR